MSARDVMIDIETLSLKQDALVLSIAAQRFELFEEGPAFYDSVVIIPNMMDQIIYGRHVDQKTQEFWAKQPEEASAHWQKPENPVPVWESMRQLNDFLAGNWYVWANGVCFDISILENMYARFSKNGAPWKYNAVRDARTIYQVCPKRREPNQEQAMELLGYTAHHPLDDCKRQVWSLWTNWPEELQSMSKYPVQPEAA